MCIGIPAEILSIEGAEIQRAARVRFPQGDQDVSLACVPEAEVGDYVIVHAGVAMSRMTRPEAMSLMDDLRKIVPDGPASEAVSPEPPEE